MYERSGQVPRRGQQSRLKLLLEAVQEKLKAEADVVERSDVLRVTCRWSKGDKLEVRIQPDL